MKFFLDANIPYSILGIFKELNLEAKHARDFGLSNAEDIEILKHSVQDNYILITKDLEFGNLKIFPIKPHGLIILRLPHNFKANEMGNTLKGFLKSINLQDLKGSISIVKLGRYRIRKL